MSRKDGEKLRGRLHAQLFVRAMRLDLKDFSRRIAAGRKELFQTILSALGDSSSVLLANKVYQVSQGLVDYVHINVDAYLETGKRRLFQ